MNFKQNKLIAFAVAGLFIVTGTYNAVVLNDESHLSGPEVQFVKRLDETYGITVQGRKFAAAVQWQKMNRAVAVKSSVQEYTVASAAPTPSAPGGEVEEAAVKEELNMSLVEVINPTKYQNGLTAGAFSGSLSTNNGTIESLSVALPNGEGLAVSFSAMTGNVFEYDLNGELYSGMMYQVDESAYVVTLTNGPLEGTRLRFSSQSAEAQSEQTQSALAESNIQVGSFGQELAPEKMLQDDSTNQTETASVQEMNLDTLKAAL